MDYALDANVFIEAARRYYSFDICPGFWQSLIHHHSEGRVFSIDRVKGEMAEKGDELAIWVADEILAACFETSDSAEIITAYGEVISWASAQGQFTNAAKTEFSEKPDAWLIAYAKATGKAVVTQEALNADVRRRVPIPNACAALEVQCLSTFEMLKSLGAAYHWTSPS